MTNQSPSTVAIHMEHLKSLIADAIALHGNQANLNHIDVSGIDDFSETFMHFREFNGDISCWDVSNATCMNSMFENSKFSGDISKWDVSEVTSMDHMFSNSAFNSDISQWDVRRVLDMSNMFEASQFNQPIESWDVGNVLRFKSMFARSRFVQPLAKWDVSSGIEFSFMFSAAAFNDDVSTWQVSDTARLRDMFCGLHDHLWPTPLFLHQSMSPWIARVHLMTNHTPADPLWARVFALTAPMAQGLDLSLPEQANAIVATYQELANPARATTGDDRIEDGLFEHGNP